jgi:stage V sporulation protein D (sporulation-specific penicillin-binding protein)
LIYNSHVNSVTSKERIPFIAAIFILLTFSAVARLFYLQVLHYGDYKAVAAAQHSLKDTISAKRGQIFAYDTISNTPFLLASSEALDLVYINPKEIENKADTVTKLSSILGMSESDLEPKFDSSQVYVILKHKLSKDQSDSITAANLKGVYLQSENWRFYPESTLAASVLGYVDNSGEGNYGIEQHFNDILKGINGYLNEETDANGIKIAFGTDGSTPAINGSDIYLTIDRYIQGEAEKVLNDTVSKFSADSGSIIVMDKTTGRILAMANAPTFDPNNYTKVKDYTVFKNRAATDLYEPGSIFKAVTMSSGLDSGKITPATTFVDHGYIVVNGTKISNALPKVYGVSSMSFILEQSLNTGTTFIEQTMGKSIFYNYIKKFGFGRVTGSEFDGEPAGLVNKPDDVDDHTYATMSFGQSISVTPLQMIRAYAAIANGGKMMQPNIIDKTVDAKGKVTKTANKEVGTVISEKSASDVTQMLINTVNKGEGGQAKVKGYKIAGKTGTAQVVKADGTGYEANKNIGSFIGFPVADNANFVVLAKIDNPKGVQWAESTAAPVVGTMLDFLLKYYQIPPTESVN